MENLKIGIGVRSLSLLTPQKTPWKATEVSINSETRQVRVLVECGRGPVDGSGDPGALRSRTWRHLDTSEFEAVITASVLCIILSDRRTMMVAGDRRALHSELEGACH